MVAMARTFLNWIFAAHPAKNDKDGSVPWKASNKLWGSGLQDEKTSLILGTIADVKENHLRPVSLRLSTPPQDVWTNFTTITTAYNTGNVAGYNVVAADKYNQTSDVVGFTDGKFEVWGRILYNR